MKKDKSHEKTLTFRILFHLRKSLQNKTLFRKFAFSFKMNPEKKDLEI